MISVVEHRRKTFEVKHRSDHVVTKQIYESKEAAVHQRSGKSNDQTLGNASRLSYTLSIVVVRSLESHSDDVPPQAASRTPTS